MATLTPAHGELLLATWTPKNAGSPIADFTSDYAALMDALASEGAVILHERAFGDLSIAPAVIAARARVLGAHTVAAPALNYIDGGTTGPGVFAGIHLLAARPSGPVRVLERNGHVVGRIVTTPSAEILALSDVACTVAERGALRADAETEAVLASAESILASEGWSFHDVIRTWFYLRDILAWYDDFNRVRNTAFRRMGLLGSTKPVLIPASTGIEGENARGGHCTLDLLAVRARAGRTLHRGQIENRRQNEATEYGSAFARGTYVDLGTMRYVFVSGTASIDDHGRSVHLNDFEAQTTHTLEAIATLLEDVGADLSDLCQATGFVKRTEDVPAWNRMASDFGLASVPTLGVLADVCRPELLFELDGTAVLPVSNGSSDQS
jgi:enamine deaminase RidA (YjgF/YER057c/UK114 family)